MVNQKILISFEVDSKELAEFNRVLLNRWNRADNLRVPMERISKYMEENIEENFSGRGSVWGKWKKRKRYYKHPVLEKTGKMRDGFSYKVGKNFVEISNPVKYFKYHQLGTVKMVSRKMWGINNRQAREIQKQIQLYLVEN